MPNIRAMRLLNTLVAGTTTGAQLQTLLSGDAGLLAEWNILLARRGQANRLAGSSAAMTALVASSAGVDALVASPTALKAVASSSSAMGAAVSNSAIMGALAASSALMQTIARSSASMAAVGGSRVAVRACMGTPAGRAAFHNSDVGLSTLAGNGSALSALRACAGYTSVSKATSNLSAVAIGLTGAALLVDWATSDTGTVTLAGRRAGSTVGNLGPYNPAAIALPGDVNIMALTAAATMQHSSGSARTTYFGVIYI